MSKLRRCTYGGNSDCRRQGGDGGLQHAAGFVHPFPTKVELPTLTDTPVLSKAGPVHKLERLEEDFNDDLYASVLSVSVGESVSSRDLVRKSIYDFDLETEEGINRLLALLPILDGDIVREVYAEIWPGYPPADVDPKRHRLEIKGYLMDYLAGGYAQVDDGGGASAGPGVEAKDEVPTEPDSTGSGQLGSSEVKDQ